MAEALPLAELRRLHEEWEDAAAALAPTQGLAVAGVDRVERWHAETQARDAYEEASLDAAPALLAIAEAALELGPAHCSRHSLAGSDCPGQSPRQPNLWCPVCRVRAAWAALTGESES